MDKALFVTEWTRKEKTKVRKAVVFPKGQRIEFLAERSSDQKGGMSHKKDRPFDYLFWNGFSRPERQLEFTLNVGFNIGV